MAVESYRAKRSSDSRLRSPSSRECALVVHRSETVDVVSASAADTMGDEEVRPNAAPLPPCQNPTANGVLTQIHNE